MKRRLKNKYREQRTGTIVEWDSGILRDMTIHDELIYNPKDEEILLVFRSKLFMNKLDTTSMKPTNQNLI